MSIDISAKKPSPMRINNPSTPVSSYFDYQKAFNRLSYLRYLTTSQECTYLETIATLDYNSAIKPIHEKLFNQYTIEDLDDDGHIKHSNCSADYYLKNKYLYITTEGALNYIEAYNSMGVQQRIKKEHEIQCVTKHIDKFIAATGGDTNKFTTIVSLGAGTSEKEIEVFKRLFNKNPIKKIYYFPLDISFHLLQLSSLKLFQHYTDPEILEINPIVADFWDAAEYKNNKSLFHVKGEIKDEINKVFILLGNTFGNYRENDLLDQLIQLMEINDWLIISVNILKNSHDDNTSIICIDQQKRLYDEYNKLEVVQWLLQPLKYIPWYAGYFQRCRYLQFDFNSSVMTGGGSEKEFITVVPNTIFYSPCLKVHSMTINNNGETHSTPSQIRLASTAKYNLFSLGEWFKGYKFECYKFDVLDWDAEEENAVLVLKKIEVPKTEVLPKPIG